MAGLLDPDGVCIICGGIAQNNSYFCGLECRNISIRRDIEMIKKPMSRKSPIPPPKTYNRTLNIKLQNDYTIIDL